MSIPENFTFNQKYASGASASPWQLSGPEKVNLKAAEMYKYDIENQYNRLDMGNSIFGKMSVDNNKEVIENPQIAPQYGSNEFAALNIKPVQVQKSVFTSGTSGANPFQQAFNFESGQYA